MGVIIWTLRVGEVGGVAQCPREVRLQTRLPQGGLAHTHRRSGSDKTRNIEAVESAANVMADRGLWMKKGAHSAFTKEVSERCEEPGRVWCKSVE